MISTQLRKLEMPISDAQAFQAVAPDIVEVVITEHPTQRLDDERNVDLICPAWLADVIWELRDALLFNTLEPSKRGAGIRLHRKDGPRILGLVLAHTPPPAWEAAWLLHAPLGAMLNGVLVELQLNVMCVRAPPPRQPGGSFTW